MTTKELLINALKIGTGSYVLMFLLLGLFPLPPLVVAVISYCLVAAYVTIRGLV